MNPSTPAETPATPPTLLFDLDRGGGYHTRVELNGSIVDRVARLTDAELAGIRGQLCPVDGCDEYDCQALCDRCGERHGSLVELRPLVIRTVCTRCSELRHCASCDAELPRYLLTVIEGEAFCGPCCHVEPGSNW
jgi:hypothetical protein